MFESLLKRLAVELNTREIPYMIFGGQAVLVYGEPRLTKDIDVTIALGPEEAQPVFDCVEALGLSLLVDDAEDFLRETFVIPAEDPSSGIRVDFVFSLTEYERGAFDRASVVHLGEVGVKFISLEDLVIYKIVAGRPRDLEDVRCVMLKNPQMDKQKIRYWLAQYDTALGENFEERFLGVVREL